MEATLTQIVVKEPVPATSEPEATLPLDPAPPVDVRQARRVGITQRIESLANLWDATKKDPLLQLIYKECWLRDRCGGLVPGWRSRPASVRDFVRKEAESSLRYAVEEKTRRLRDVYLSEHNRRGRPKPSVYSSEKAAYVDATLQRSMRLMIADLIEQVLELPPSEEEMDDC